MTLMAIAIIFLFLGLFYSLIVISMEFNKPQKDKTFLFFKHRAKQWKNIIFANFCFIIFTFFLYLHTKNITAIYFTCFFIFLFLGTIFNLIKTYRYKSSS
ncbi:hypothetical protein BKH44_06855 [Helicobacter sp. 13S00477-4]|nr:hypothetical protein BKH44_06855 [Helicobacter sp. 13S00477-4]